MRYLIVSLLGVLALTQGAAAVDKPLLAQQPALSATAIVFVFAGDLWSVPRAGRRRAAADDRRRRRVEPVVLARRQVDRVHRPVRRQHRRVRRRRRRRRAEAPDVASRSRRRARLDARWPQGALQLVAPQLLRVSASSSSPRSTAGSKKSCRCRWATKASLSPDGQRIAYVPLPRAFSVWKRYRGGQTTPIWIATLSNSRIEKVPRENSNDFSPMWVDDKVYFLSDRNGAGDAVFLRHQAQEGDAGRGQQRHGLQVRLRRPRRHRHRAVRADPAVRPEVGDAGAGEDRARRRHRRAAAEVRQRRAPAHQRAHLADRRARAVRGARRDPHGAGRKGRPAQPHRNDRRHRARSRPGRPTASGSRTSPTRAASTSCTCATRWGSSRRARSGSKTSRRSTCRRAGRPTARRSPTSTRT